MRRSLDAYMSAGWFLEPILPILGEGSVVLEPCCGAGDLSSGLAARGFSVVANDLDPAREADFHLDAADPLSWMEFPDVDWVVSNLPFNQAIRILPHAVRHARRGVAVVLRLTFLEPTKDRREWLSQNPLSCQIVLPRYSFTGDGRTDSVTCAWMVWERGEPPAVFSWFPDRGG